MDYSKLKGFKPACLAAAIAATLLSSGQLSAEGLVLEEVVVTAQKRAENLQDIAASITAVSSAALDDNGITSFTDATKMIPGLNMTQTNATNTQVSLRGVTYDRQSAANEAVDVYWNGAVYRASAMFTSMFDVERIEVLRGPQGTLQGKTSPAGAILMHTKRPSFDGVEGQVKASVSDDGTNIGEFGLSLPVSETLAIRLAGIYNSNEGKGNTNVYTGTQDDTDVTGSRITVVYEPSDDFSAILTSEYVENSVLETFQVVGSGVHGDISLADNLGVTARPHAVEIQTEISTLELNLNDVGGHTITSVTSYNSTEMSEYNDLDVGDVVAGEFHSSDVEQDVYTFAQELRIDRNDDSWWQYTAGVYYAKTNTHILNYADVAPNSASFGVDVEISIELEEFGYFTHNRIELTEDSELQVGLRYSRIRRDDISTLAFGSFIQPLTTSPDGVDDAFTGGVKYIYNLSDDLMAYTSLDASYRPSGSGVNPRISANAHRLSFNEENTLAFEVGFKSTLFDGRMQLNGALYQQHFNEYQNFFQEMEMYDSAGLFVDPLVGNNDAIATGIELEAVGLISEDWRATMALSYNDFKFADGEVGYCNDGTPPASAEEFISTCELGGQRVGDSPNWSVSMSSDYNIPLETVDVFIRGLYKFNGDRQSPSIAGAAGGNGSYSVLDVFTGVRSKDQLWEVSLWAKNILDKAAETKKFTMESSGYREVAVEAERSLGASLRYNFSL